jgi:putative FmdB family regulatory protein
VPLYEYVCENGHKLEQIRSIFDDKEPIDCPDCGTKLTQVIAQVSVSFKGSGFYSTDKKKG